MFRSIPDTSLCGFGEKNAPFPNFHFLAILPSNKGRSIERTLKKSFFCVLWPPNLSNWPQYWKGTTTQNFFPTLPNLQNFNDPLGTSQQAGHTFGPQISWFLGANSLFLTSNLLGQKKSELAPRNQLIWGPNVWSACSLVPNGSLKFGRFGSVGKKIWVSDLCSKRKVWSQKKWIGPQKSADLGSKCVVSLFTGPQWVIEVW